MTDRLDNHEGGGSFVMELLTGTVLGAGLGMLFAPKAGSELRNQHSEQAGALANQAQEGYRTVTESAGQWAEKGKEAAGELADRGRTSTARRAKPWCAVRTRRRRRSARRQASWRARPWRRPAALVQMRRAVQRVTAHVRPRIPGGQRAPALRVQAAGHREAGADRGRAERRATDTDARTSTKHVARAAGAITWPFGVAALARRCRAWDLADQMATARQTLMSQVHSSSAL
jgi:gas vesicle protein